MDDKKRVQKIIAILRKKYPVLKCALNYKTPFELLVATILSAQSTDAQVNKLTLGLFKKYRSVRDFADAPLEELQRDSASVNFYRNKAKNIQSSARMIIERFGSEVPRTMQELITLPGVARKTANIVLSEAFGVIEGIAVDTHVRRLSNRLGLSTEEDPVKVERDLMELVPKKEWADFTHLLISHGRSVCLARAPRHRECAIAELCPSRE